MGNKSIETPTRSPKCIPITSLTTTAIDVTFGRLADLHTSISTVLPLSGRFTGQIFAAVRNFWFAMGVFLLLTPRFALCASLSADSPLCLLSLSSDCDLDWCG